MLHVLIGEDDFSIRQALEEIKKGIGDATALMSNTTVFDGRQVTLEQLRSACETVPFLSEKRLVIVEGLLERFESGNKTGRKKSSRQPGQPEEYKTIADGIKQLPEFTELVLLGGSIRAGNPLLRELATTGKVRTFPRLKQSQLSQWVLKRVKATGGSISPQAVNLLIRFVGNDLWIMAGEVDKLDLFTGGRRIEEDDIRAVVSYAQEASIFAMIDAVLEFRVGAAQELLQQLLKQGAASAQLLVMLSRQVRIIFQIREMRGRKKTRADIQGKLGLTSDFVLRKAWDQADRYSPARLREVYHRLLETDISIKTGKLDGEIALSILIAELGQRGTVSA
ncbi:MAG: DNA polymerase III subunit delta [Dehalococcoidales bacterium]|nr:DNA polymerase III subunit delta [Dehalococcoidales bacterium]